MTLELGPEDLFNIGGAVLDAALAGWLLYLNAARRTNRAFAFTLIALALASVFNILTIKAAEVGDIASVRALGTTSLVAGLVGKALALHFVFVFPTPRPWYVRGPWARGALALVTGILVAFDFAFPDLYFTLAARPGGAIYISDIGPLALTRLVPSATLILLAAGIAYLRAPAGPSRRALHLVAVGALLFTLSINVEATLTRGFAVAGMPLAGDTVPGGFGPFIIAVSSWPALVIQFGVLALVLRRAKRTQDADLLADARQWRLATLVSLAGASVGLVLHSGGPEYLGWDRALNALPGYVFPLIVTYALVRHQLFGIELKIRWTIRTSTIAGAFVAIFFIVSSVAQNYLSGWGALYGGIAAGLLLFALHPLQRFAERLANAAVPGARAATDMAPSERAAIYRDQARVAWADGIMERSERVLLDNLRERLGLSRDEAALIESEAAVGS